VGCLTASYELLTRQIRASATHVGGNIRARQASARLHAARREARAGDRAPVPGLALVQQHPARQIMGSELQREAWQWALANRADDGSLPSGKQIADRYGRHERWGRLVKHAGSTGKLSHHERTADEQVSP
jgi:hypothetical protein